LGERSGVSSLRGTRLPGKRNGRERKKGKKKRGLKGLVLNARTTFRGKINQGTEQKGGGSKGCQRDKKYGCFDGRKSCARKRKKNRQEKQVQIERVRGSSAGFMKLRGKPAKGRLGYRSKRERRSSKGQREGQPRGEFSGRFLEEKGGGKAPEN